MWFTGRGTLRVNSKQKIAMITEMLKYGSLSLQKIASYARVSVDEIVAIQQEISNTQ